MKPKKQTFIGYTTKYIRPCWTSLNMFNFTAVIEKTKAEAAKRYDEGENFKNIIKVRITIEEIK